MRRGCECAVKVDQSPSTVFLVVAAVHRATAWQIATRALARTGAWRCTIQGLPMSARRSRPKVRAPQPHRRPCTHVQQPLCFYGTGELRDLALQPVMHRRSCMLVADCGAPPRASTPRPMARHRSGLAVAQRNDHRRCADAACVSVPHRQPELCSTATTLLWSCVWTNPTSSRSPTMPFRATTARRSCNACATASSCSRAASAAACSRTSSTAAICASAAWPTGRRWKTACNTPSSRACSATCGSIRRR